MSDIIEKIDKILTLLAEGEDTKWLYDNLSNWVINQQFLRVLRKKLSPGKRLTAESAKALFMSTYPEGFEPVGGGPMIMPREYEHADWNKLVNYWSGKVMSRNRNIEEASVPSSIRTKISKKLHDISRHYHKSIPLVDIFNALKAFGILPVQEDGTEWEGMLSGKEGRATIDLVNVEDKKPYTSSLILSWHKMESGSWEITAYLS